MRKRLEAAALSTIQAPRTLALAQSKADLYIAADDNAPGEHVIVIIVPLAGGTRS